MQYVTGFEKTRLPHTQYQTYDFIRNGLLAQYTIIIPLSALLQSHESGFCVSFSQTLCKPQVYGALVPLAGHGSLVLMLPTKQMSSILSLECCEHKQSPPGPQIGPLAFNCSSYSILYSYIESTLHPPHLSPLLLPHVILLPSQKSCSKQLEFGFLKLLTHTIMANE